MFDKNYLDHDLVECTSTPQKIFLCKKCNILVGHSFAKYGYSYGWYMPVMKLNLTCNEIIIKGLLE